MKKPKLQNTNNYSRIITAGRQWLKHRQRTHRERERAANCERTAHRERESC